jgi:hypothetical protein
MQDIKLKVLEFLHTQVNKGSIPHIRKGMVEDLEKFISDLSNEKQIQSMADRMANAVLVTTAQAEKVADHE